MVGNEKPRIPAAVEPHKEEPDIYTDAHLTDGRTVQVSIILICRNEVRHIAACLDSLLHQDMAGLTWEVIVADGMSDDGTREILARYCVQHPELGVLNNPDRNIASGLNAAIRVAQGEIILRMDAHSSYAPDYCRRCVETLSRTGADNVGGPARTRAEGKCARAIAAAYHSRFSTGGARFHQQSYEGWVDTVPYGCWRKATLERLGLFDETFIRNEDDELNLRLVRAGGKIWQDPAIVSWYSPRTTLADLFRQYLQYGFWKVAVIRKHRLPGSWRHLAPAMFVLANILLGFAVAVSSVADLRPMLSGSAALWMSMLVAYGAASVAASLVTARKAGWATLLYLPIIFPTYHFSYGVGFLLGLFRFASSHHGGVEAESAFSRITR